MMWRPVSDCGDQCMPGGDERVSRARAVMRMTRASLVLLCGLLVVPILRGTALQWLARELLAAFDVKVRWRGPVPRPGTLLVSNHVSWIDVLALHAVAPVRLVAKNEVGSWPGVGLLAKVTGTIFINREQPKSLPRTVDEVAAALRAGGTVALFPEGTTFCGNERGRFRPALFQSAIDAGAPVLPVSIGYGTSTVAFLGEDTLWASMCRVAALRDCTVSLVAGHALRPEPGADRRSLARAAQASTGVRTARFDLAA
jgi:1-acyl-sn-glycerol-3-phosphate acyltransferase